MDILHTVELRLRFISVGRITEPVLPSSAIANNFVRRRGQSIADSRLQEQPMLNPFKAHLADRRRILHSIGLAAVATAVPGWKTFAADKPAVGIIGTGRVAAALGPRLATMGYRVIYGSRSPEAKNVIALLAASGPNANAASPAVAAQRADVIFFAVPWTAAETTIKSLGDLGGKLVMDATNPVIVDGGNDRPVATNSSGAQMIQAWATNAHVVKAFNTTNWSVMADPSKVAGKVTIPLAGDDAPSKEAAARIVTDLGFTPFDTGPLSNARHIEEMALLYISLLLQKRPDAAEFALIPRSK